MKSADLITNDDTLALIYKTLTHNFVNNFNYFEHYDIIMLLFEFSQKRSLDQYVIKQN